MYPHMANSPKDEADYFLSKVTPKKGEIVVLDWEGYDSNNSGVSKTVQRAYKDAYIKYMKSKLPNNPVGMYCNSDYWKNVDTNSYCGDFLWIATAGRAAGDPGIAYKWLFHQYSTAGGIDHDYCTLKDRAALKAWALSFVQNTPEENMAVTDAEMTAIAKKVLTLDGVIEAPSPVNTANLYWTLESYTKDTNAKVRDLETKLAALQTAVSKLSTPTIDVNAFAAAVVKAIGQDLAN